MEVSTYLGQMLSTKIKKELSPCVSLVKMAFKKKFGDDIPKAFSQEVLIDFINTAFKETLEKLKVSNPQEIVDYMLEEIEKNKGVFTMSSI